MINTQVEKYTIQIRYTRHLLPSETDNQKYQISANANCPEYAKLLILAERERSNFVTLKQPSQYTRIDAQISPGSLNQCHSRSNLETVITAHMLRFHLWKML